MHINALATKKVVIAVLAITLVFGLLFAVTATRAHALTLSELVELFIALEVIPADKADQARSVLNQQSDGGTSSAAVCPFTWTRNLSNGDTGDDVKNLQVFLNADAETRVSTEGPGSPGNETSFFGPRTGGAVAKFQTKYQADVLTPVGLTVATEFFGPSSRAKANALCATGDGGGDNGGGTTPPPAGFSGLQVESVAQPANSLAPDNASRVPFTKFKVSAGNADVTINNVTVKRIGLGSNSAISGLVLLDGNGVQLGNEKTLNSNNQATVGEKTTVKAGTSMIYTVAANMPSDNSSRDGEQLSFQVVSINTSATVTGSLPISGATHTVNASLAIGTATMQKGANDPDAASTQEVGTTGFTFAGVRLTAGSAEDIRIKSVRWDQTGSASDTDIENVKVIIDGVEHDTVLSSDGDHYTAVLPGDGLLVKEGLSVEISVKGDIVNGANRTVNFDIERATDIHVVGETFDYGVTPSIGGNNDSDTSSDDSEFNDGTDDGGTPPFYDGRVITIGAGTLNVSSSSSVPAGNIANGANDVSLGGFLFDVEGEAVTWSSIKFTIATTSGGGTSGDKTITNISLVDGNGNIIAGPSDPTAAGSTVTLSDSATLQPGKHELIVRGNLDTDWANNDTIIIKHTPTTQITDLKGDVSSNSITPTPASQVNAKTQTISAGSLSVAPSSSLTSQNIIANSNGVVLGRYTLDSVSSGENVRINTVKIRGITGTSADLDELNTLQLFVDGVALNTGSNINNPSGNAIAADATLTFTLDGSGLTLKKGTTAVLELKGNIGTSTGDSNTTFRFDFSASITDGDWSVSGVSTGKDITEDLDTAASGATLTITSAGTLTASVDSSDPVEKWYLPGETATIGIFDFLSTNEDIEVTDLGLILNRASASPASITELSLWEVGASVPFLTKALPAFNGTNNQEVFDFDSAGLDFIAKANDDADLIVKVKFADIGTNKPGSSGNLVRVSTSTTAANMKARGVSSGTAVNIAGSAGTTTGARVFRALPKVAKENVTSNVLANGTVEIYRFSVEATGDDVALYKFSFNVATTGATVTAIKVTELETGKIVVNSLDTVDTNGDLDAVVDSTTYGTAVITVPGGVKRTYKVEGTVTNAGNSGDSVSTRLLGDSAVAGIATLAGSATDVDAITEDDFIWSPQSTTTAAAANFDWFNGFRVPGIEFDDLGTTAVSNS